MPVPSLPRVVHLTSLALLGAASIACSAPASPSLDARGTRTDGGAFAITLVNDGSSDMTAVKVTTGEGVAPIEVDRSAARAVTVLHEYPIVTLTNNGKQYTAHPVEGFVEGFNPSKAPGQYLVKLKIVPEYQLLDVRVDPAP
jgi:hypothetical protein